MHPASIVGPSFICLGRTLVAAKARALVLMRPKNNAGRQCLIDALRDNATSLAASRLLVIERIEHGYVPPQCFSNPVLVEVWYVCQ
jgi:hypothetical protein